MTHAPNAEAPAGRRAPRECGSDTCSNVWTPGSRGPIPELCPTCRGVASRWLELFHFRKKDGRTLAALALATGLSYDLLHQLESGVRQPNVHHVKLLARELNIPVSVLEPGTTATATELDVAG